MTTTTAAPKARSDDARAVAGGAVAGVVGQVLARGAALVFVLVATRHLAPSAYGDYAVAAALALVTGVFADLGTSSATARLVARGELSAEALLRATLVPCFGLGLVAAAAAAAFAAAAYPADLAITCALALAATPVAAVGSSILGALEGRGRLRARPLAVLIQTLVVAVGGMIAVIATGSARPAAACIAGGAVAMTAVGVVAAKRAGLALGPLGFEPAVTRLLLRTALPFAGTAAAVIVYQRADIVAVSLLADRRQAALYELGVRGLEAFTYVVAAVAGPACYVLNRRAAGGDDAGFGRAVASMSNTLQLVALPVGALGAVLGPMAATTVFGSTFAGAGPSVAILLGGAPLSVLVMLQGTVAMAGRDLLAALRAPIAGVVAMLVGDVVLVPSHGATGAAVASVTALAVYAAVLDRHLRRCALARVPLPPMGAVAAAGLAAGAAYAARPLGLAAAVVTGLVTYVVAAVGFGQLRAATVSELRSLLRR